MGDITKERGSSSLLYTPSPHQSPKQKIIGIRQRQRELPSTVHPAIPPRPQPPQKLVLDNPASSPPPHPLPPARGDPRTEDPAAPRPGEIRDPAALVMDGPRYVVYAGRGVQASFELPAASASCLPGFPRTSASPKLIPLVWKLCARYETPTPARASHLRQVVSSPSNVEISRINNAWVSLLYGTPATPYYTQYQWIWNHILVCIPVFPPTAPPPVISHHAALLPLYYPDVRTKHCPRGEQ